jgi:hypothetical protein
VKLSIDHVGKTCRGGVRSLLGSLHAALCHAVLQSATPLDSMGATPAGTERGNAAVFAALTTLLLALALLGRRRRIRG